MRYGESRNRVRNPGEGIKATTISGREGIIMINDISRQVCSDSYEYYGNTEIVLNRKRGDVTVWRDWILFDSAEEASEYFNDFCCAMEA